MIDNDWGRIISFSGMNAQRGYPGASAVSVAKHAVWGLTKAFAVEFGTNGITANIIAPGTFPPNNVNIANDAKYSALLKGKPVRPAWPHRRYRRYGCLSLFRKWRFCEWSDAAN
jgi:3-oxoacyl-[acyl-carrier protein] reductase